MNTFTFSATTTGNFPHFGMDPFAGLGIWFFAIIALLIIWTIIWKGLALYKSAQRGQKVWFVIMLIINTAGILEIIYLLMNREPKIPPIINPLAPKDFTPPSNPNLS